MQMESRHHFVPNAPRKPLMNMIFFMVQSGLPDYQKGIKTILLERQRWISASGLPDYQKGIKTAESV